MREIASLSSHVLQYTPASTFHAPWMAFFIFPLKAISLLNGVQASAFGAYCLCSLFYVLLIAFNFFT